MTETKKCRLIVFMSTRNENSYKKLIIQAIHASILQLVIISKMLF